MMPQPKGKGPHPGKKKPTDRVIAVPATVTVESVRVEIEAANNVNQLKPALLNLLKLLR